MKQVLNRTNIPLSLSSATTARPQRIASLFPKENVRQSLRAAAISRSSIRSATKP
jgi:hypothetical protein